MKTYLTKLTAVNQLTGELRIFAGPNIEAPTLEMAQAQCEATAPYLTVIGELVAEVATDSEQATHYNHSLN